MIFNSMMMNSDHNLIFSPIDSHADDDIDTAGHEGVDERHHEMSLVREIEFAGLTLSPGRRQWNSC